MKFWLPTWSRNQVRKLTMLEEYFEEEEEQQQQPASEEVAITNMASEINPAICVLAAKGGHSAPDGHGPVRGAWFCGISHKSKFVICHPLCEYYVS